MKSISVSKFVCDIISIDLYIPSPDKKGTTHYGSSDLCWMCGSHTHGTAWRKHDVLSDNYTNTAEAIVQDSDSICVECATLMYSKAFHGVVAKRGIDIKIWPNAGWHSYSHFACEPDIFECPKPSRVREILLNPPSLKFALGINASGQKHTIVRTQVAHNGKFFPVHFDDQTFIVDHSMFVKILSVVEELSELGISKDQTLTGQYHPESIRRAGLSSWRVLEERMKQYRAEYPQLVSLAHFCGRSPTYFKNKGENEE